MERDLQQAKTMKNAARRAKDDSFKACPVFAILPVIAILCTYQWYMPYLGLDGG